MEKGKRSDVEVRSIEGAVISIKENLYDAADPDSTIVVTVHKTSTGSAGNVWQTTAKGEHKLLPQRDLELNPDPIMLLGEVARLAEKFSDSSRNDLRPKLAIAGLILSAKSVIEKSQK